MTLTPKQIYDLNNMNVAAQNINLGTTLSDAVDDISEFSGSLTSLNNVVTEFSGSLTSLDNIVTEVSGSLTSLEETVNGISEPLTVAALKVHASGSFALTQADTWEDVTFDLMIDEETTAEFQYFDQGEATEDKSIILCSASGIFWVGGCLHPYWGGAPATTTAVASRIITSTDEGSTWTEKRCTQSLNVSSKNSGDYLTQPYHGTISIVPGELIKLQIRVDSTEVILQGDSSIFDNPTAATLGIYGSY